MLVMLLPEALRAHDPPSLNEPVPAVLAKLAVPEGEDLVPVAPVSLTVAVQVVDEGPVPISSAVGEHATDVVVGRLSTVRLKGDVGLVPPLLGWKLAVPL